MPKNKLIIISILLYSLTTFLLTIYTLGLASKVFLNIQPNVPFLFFPDVFVFFLIIPIILWLLAIIYGLYKCKKWAYKLGVIFGLMTFVNFIASLSSSAPDLLNILSFVPAIPLYFAKKSFR